MEKNGGKIRGGDRQKRAKNIQDLGESAKASE